MTIDQEACSESKNCPKDNGHTEDEEFCKGKLTPAKDSQKIEFKFVADKTPQYSDILATSFFVNQDSDKCPFTKC